MVDRDLQARRDLRFGRALDAIRSRTRKQGSDKMTLDEINAVIREVREERRHEAGLVLDTNVLVSGFLSDISPLAQILNAMREKYCRIFRAW